MRRADELLFALGLVESRSKARSLIEEGKVKCSGKPVDKPSRKYPDAAEFEIDADAATLRFVSRAGLKLDAFLENFAVDLRGLRVLDAGASTGGFTDCALSRGAAQCCCVDIGTGQLHPKVAADARVKNFEQTDVRNLTPEFFKNELFDFICADLSFISLEKVLPALWPLLKDGGAIVCLIKPQFESSPEIMRRACGILRDSSARLAAVEKVEKYFFDNFRGAKLIGEMESPVKGGDGNVEYLVGYAKAAHQ